MGLGGISIWQLLIVLAIVVLLFGTKRLRTLGTDLGGAIKGFRKSINSEDEASERSAPEQEKVNPDNSGKTP
jgi:sec-independent protein translocase protein TatA